jgi:hypothetical protein
MPFWPFGAEAMTGTIRLEGNEGILCFFARFPFPFPSSAPISFDKLLFFRFLSPSPVPAVNI